MMDNILQKLMQITPLLPRDGPSGPLPIELQLWMACVKSADALVSSNGVDSASDTIPSPKFA